MPDPSASRRAARRLLVAMQVMLIVATLFSPIPAAAADDPSADPSPTPSAEPTPIPDATAEPTPEATPEATPSPEVSPEPSATPDTSPTPEASPEPTAEPTPEPSPTPEASPTPDPSPTPTPTPTPTPELATEPFIVTFFSDAAVEDQDAILASVDAVETGSIPQLNMRTILLAPSAVTESVDALRADSRVARVDADRLRIAEETPTDPSYSDQWALPQIDWDDAHGTYAAAGSAVVAILDTGVDASHPDLDGSIVSGASILDGSTWATDPNGHGTAMAGIVAAETDNGEGISGVGYAGVKVMPVTVLGADGTGQDSDVIAGVVWAVDNGADVILMAFSSESYSVSLQSAVDYAWSRDVVLVAAAGNDGSSAGAFPAGDRGVIGVANTTSLDTLASDSNFGASVFLGAPGIGIYTTDIGGGYRYISGTSASAAVVAGAAAELIAVDPSASNGVVVGRLARTADPAGTQEETGNGRVNLWRALGDTATDAIQPAGAAPFGAGGPFVGPYVAAANNDAHVAPGWAATNTTVTFSTLYRVTTGGVVQNVTITLPAGYTNISIAATAFSSGTWNSQTVNQVARTVEVALTSGTGLAVGGWARIDVTATTPPANQTGNAAEWVIETSTDTAGTTGQQDDNPPVLIGFITNPAAIIEIVDGGGIAIPNPVLQNAVAATVRVRITAVQVGGTTIKYTDIAVPTCFSAPSGVTTLNPGGNPYSSIIVTDGFIRLSGGSIATNGTLIVEFTTTPNCVSGSYAVTTEPSTNATNPPSGTNQSVSTTGGSITVAAGLADLSITKTDSPDPVTTGGTLTYTIGVHNAGPDPAAAVKVVDTLPAGVTYVSGTGTNWVCNNASGTVTCNLTGGNLASGADAPTLTITVTAPITPGSITNSATVSSPNDNTPANNTATATTAVANQADLSITKADSADPVIAGTDFDYTITVTNNGPSDNVGFTVSDVLPAGTTYVSDDSADCVEAAGTVTCTSAGLADGAAVTYTLTVHVASSVADGTILSNTATITATSTTDPDATNDSDTETTTVVTQADVTIDKDGPATVVAGISMTYTLTVINTGPSDAQAVLVTDNLPSELTNAMFCTYSSPDTDCTATTAWTGSTTLTTIAASATIKIKITADVPASTADGTLLENQASADSTTDDPDETNNTSEVVETTVVREADLGITKTASPSSVFSGDNITYAITVTNYGPSFSSGFTVIDTLDSNVKFVSATAGCTHTGAAPDGFGGTVTCVRSTDLAVNGTATYTIVVQTRFPLAPTTITNTATVTGDDEEPADATHSNTATTTTFVVLRPATGSSTMTDSAFKIQTDLSPWTISDFEVLVNNQNTIVATNPGQFYYHQRVISPFTVTTSIDFKIDWPSDFVPQVTGGNPIHAYVRLDGSNTWTDWTPQSTGNCWNATQNSCSGSDGTITVNNVPAKAEVWVTVHLDLRCKGQNISCLVPSPLTKPVVYGPFTSTATIKVAGVPVAASTTSTSLIGRGKKVTMVYGIAKDSAGAVLPNVWIQLTQSGKSAVSLTESDGSYLYYDGQLCTGDGLTSCPTGTTWTFANGTSSGTLAILGNGPAPAPSATYPAGYTKFKITSNGATVVAQTSNPPTTTFGIAKGSSYTRDWVFIP